MKILILAAMDKELELLVPLLDDMQETGAEGSKGWRGHIGDHDVLVMKCGIGKVNAAMNAYKAIRSFNPDKVINSGVAGGASSTMPVGMLLVADNAAYHDVWCGPGTEYGSADGFPVMLGCDLDVLSKAGRVLEAGTYRFGLICTGDKFITTAEEIAEIHRRFPDALACDMESAAIGQVCTAAGIPFSIIRVVSDTPGQGENISQYRNFWTEAPRKTFRAISAILSGEV